MKIFPWKVYPHITYIDWGDDQTKGGVTGLTSEHLWQESWDDEDLTDRFSNELRCDIMLNTDLIEPS